MNLKTKMLILSLAALLAGCGISTRGGSSGDTSTASEPIDLTLLHINDHHSHLDAENSTLLLATGAGHAKHQRE